MTTDSNKALLQAALDQSAAVLRDAGPADPELLAEVFEAIGRLLAAGASADELHARGTWSVDRALVDAALDREPIADALESEAFSLLEALHLEPHDSEATPDPAMLLSRFTVRDQAELELLGAAFVADCAPAAVAAGASARLGFDLAVRPHAFKLIAHNVERAERSSWIHPQHRPRFWWWFEGLSLDPRAASAMSAVASLVARSADAREHFQRLVRAEESWAALGAARRGRARDGD